MSPWRDLSLTELLLAQTPLIDVRSPIEFAAGHVPHSINLPLMTDQERHEVGLCYKEEGQAAAIELGHRLVRGSIKDERVQRWYDFILGHPTAQVMCFRGGLRSQISCQWLAERGIQRTPLPGGYKRVRQFLLATLNEAPLPQFYRLGGLTGVGKSQLLKQLSPCLDLEELACHRGSAFGSLGTQPTQASFENALAAQLLGQTAVLVEDESIALGRLRLPERFYAALRLSPLLVIEASLEERIAHIHRDYVQERDAEFFLQGVKSIERKLGGARAQELKQLIQVAFARGTELHAHTPWIALLLTSYYDPMYEWSLKQQNVPILCRGSAQEIAQYWQSLTKN